MALVLQLLPLLLSRAHGDPGASLDGRPGDRVNLSCVGVSHPIRWAWAPSFPACKGLSKGRRPILWASSSGIPTVPPLLPFAGRLRSLDPGIRRLELLLSAGDSGTFFCRGRHEDESRTVLHVLGDRADCRAQGPTHGARPRLRFHHSPHLLCPPHIAPLMKAEPQRPMEEEEPKIPGDLDQEPSLLYADLDHRALRRPRRLSTVVPADASTVYAVVV
ncbi:megakaryocyte and platelet inhibitory receptor G6b isoform X3 [Marmota monax]|uniref:megakaryocyte and platelet inhibitory receptor G6b isoform X3 n=1 Tax=Marmota marmota marmota TaxID=9994 RepID=UPI000762B883|nr:megakaryocyte and platelet inhibitory receptor G6b isoform X3 [Marmota marmota marmota]XP_027777707.1 megakaryocyte and platelet inhibitory receptor G6b isoform X3 [Marmota flaviventris]XP_046323882.1 megakaryocyte and platelet inhibitory receptor G6b isoform X3 [Marmota monax]